MAMPTPAPLDDLRQALTEAGVEPKHAEMFMAGVKPVDASDRTELHVLLDERARKGKSALIVSRRFRNLFISWDKPLSLARNLGTAGGGALAAEQAVEHFAQGTSGDPLFAVLAAIAGMLLAWKTVIGAMEVPLSNDHAKIVYYLFRDCKETGATLQDVHAVFDAALGAPRVDDLLTDLGELGLIGFVLDEIQLRDSLVAA